MLTVIDGWALRRTEENNWSTSATSGRRISASLSHGGPVMEIAGALRDLLMETAASLSGAERRHFMANALDKLRLGQREAAGLFGWGRDTLRKAGHEMSTGLTCADAFSRRGRKPVEHRLPHLFDDLHGLVQDHLQTDPTFQTTGLYCRLSATEVRKQLIARKGYTDEGLPSVQTIGDKLNLLGFRLRSVIKSRPQKKCRKPTPSSRMWRRRTGGRSLRKIRCAS